MTSQKYKHITTGAIVDQIPITDLAPSRIGDYEEYNGPLIPGDCDQRASSYEQRVRAYEAEGMTTSDAQAVADADGMST